MLHRRLTLALAGACATLVLASCGGQDESARDRPDQEETVEQPSAPASGSPEARAVADLAERLGVAAAEVAVDSVEEVTWKDGSLGCAEKGMMYTQALVDGSRITLRADGKTYEYHSGGNRAPFLCEDPTQ